MKRSLLTLVLLFLVLQLSFAERLWVPQRTGGAGTNTLTVANGVTSTELASSPITVGVNPVDIAADTQADTIPSRLFCVNQGGDSLSLISHSSLTVTDTLTGGPGSSLFFGTYGAFDDPAAIERVTWNVGGILWVAMAVVDRKVIASAGNAKGTLRLFNPTDLSVYRELRDTSTSTNYEDIKQNQGRLFITDSGDKGVVVVKTDLFSNPLTMMPSVLIYNGFGEFADFIKVTDGTKLQQPARMATYQNKVLVTDRATNFVTVLNANYASDPNNNNPAAAVHLHINVGGPSFDVAVVGTKAYVSTQQAGGAALVVIDLNTFTAGAPVFLFGTDQIEAVGVNQAGTVLYVGTRPGGTSTVNIYRVDATVTTPVLLGPPNPVIYTSAGHPFRFFFTSETNPPVAADPGFSSGGGGSSCSLSGIIAPFHDPMPPIFGALLVLLWIRCIVAWRRRNGNCSTLSRKG